MSKKYYAVKKGRKTGVYFTWEQCKTQVDGYSGALYKSFGTKEEAEAYLGTGSCILRQEGAALKQKKKNESSGQKNVSAEELPVRAYVDGSYNQATREFSYGMVILRDGEELKSAKKYQDRELASMRNVAGEIKGAEAAMRYAVENSLGQIAIYHDYEGIARWCLGDWKTNKEGTKKYKAYYDSIKDQVAVSFIKVKGHSNDKYNDMADELAKQALGLVP